MTFELPALPYDKHALEPYLSAETLEHHYGKHHKAYIDKLNELIAGTEYADRSLEDIIRSSSGPLFNQAAQVWNHTFYWHCLSPHGGGEPQGKLRQAIDEHFGSFSAFREAFNSKALANFGAGWTWLVKTSDGELSILNTGNAETPVAEDFTPLMTVDVWEHAYYIDYRNGRAKYLENIWNILNWDFVAQNYS